MKAVFIEQPGDAGALRYADFPKPEAAAGQVLVKLAAAGVNFIDTYQRSGLYKVPALSNPSAPTPPDSRWAIMSPGRCRAAVTRNLRRCPRNFW